MAAVRNMISRVMGSRPTTVSKSIPSSRCDEPPRAGQKKKVKCDSSWQQTGLPEGGPQDLEVIPSYSGQVTATICRREVNFTIFYSVFDFIMYC